MKRFQFIYLSWLVIVLLGCQAQPQGMSATITSVTTPPAATPTPSPTKPVVTSSSTSRLLPPTLTQENTSMATAAITPFPSTTPGPTPTAMVITPDPNQPEGEKSPGGFRIDAVWTGNDFCITWEGSIFGITSYLIILEYIYNPPNQGKSFVYEVGPDVTQLIVPKEHSPSPDESPEWCVRRNFYDITVIAVRPDFRRTVGNIAVHVDCIPEDPVINESP